MFLFSSLLMGSEGQDRDKEATQVVLNILQVMRCASHFRQNQYRILYFVVLNILQVKRCASHLGRISTEFCILGRICKAFFFCSYDEMPEVINSMTKDSFGGLNSRVGDSIDLGLSGGNCNCTRWRRQRVHGEGDAHSHEPGEEWDETIALSILFEAFECPQT